MAQYYMPRKREMFQFRMDEPTKDALEQLAAWKDISQAEACRRAILHWFEMELQRKKEGVRTPRL